MNTRTDAYAFDLASAVIDADTGWLTVDGTAAIVGVMDYETGAEYVPPETLEQTAADLVGMPVTVEHPEVTMLDAETTRAHQVGTVIAARFDGERLRVKLRLTDTEAIAAIQAGKRELSPGYRVDVTEKNGAANGRNYQFVQVGRKYNHLALVDRARGGRAAKLDSSGKNDMEQVSVMIDGVEYLVPPQVALKLEQLDTANVPPVEDAAAPAVPASVAAKTDSMDEIADRVAAHVLKELRADRERIDSAARALGDTIAKCRPHLPQSYRTDGLDEGRILADTIVALVPDLKARVAASRLDTGALRGMLDGVLAARPTASAPSTTSAANTDSEDAIAAARTRQAARRAGGDAK